jgi:hypothetical protein
MDPATARKAEEKKRVWRTQRGGRSAMRLRANMSCVDSRLSHASLYSG